MFAFIRSTGGKSAVVGVLLLTALPGLAACRGDDAQSTPPPSAQQSASAVMNEFVQCARANGMPSLPDPQIDSNGEARFPAGTPDPPPSVEKACKSILDRLPASQEVEGGVTQAEIQALVAFSRCMREKGIAQFPDPRPDGTFKLSGTPLEREGKSPRMLDAQNACKRLNPDKLGRIRVN